MSWRLIRLGRLDEAEALAERVLAGRPFGTSGVVVQASMGHLALRRGKLDVAVEHFERSLGMLGRTTDSMWVGNTAYGRAEVELWRSDPQRSWQLIARSLETMGEDEYVFYTARAYATAARAAAELAERARALGDDEGFEEAQRHGDEVLQRFRLLLASERWPGGPPPPESVAFEAQCVAELTRARGTPDPGAWAAVAERFQALGLPFELAYARWRQAEALVLGGDRAAAQDALREAAGLAREMRAPLLAAEIDGLARRGRIALDEEAPAEVGGDSDLDALGLTDRERAVLELVAEGRTNREIGEALFMAEKTASVHVSRILAKLGVRSRVEAATAAHRLGSRMTRAASDQARPDAERRPGASSAPGDGGRG